MLETTNKKISVESKCIVNDMVIATFRAAIDIDTANLAKFVIEHDKEMCMKHRAVLRADQAAFEAEAYKLQDAVADALEK